LLRASSPLRVTLKPLVTYRDYHSHNRGAQALQLETGAAHCRVQAFTGARPYSLSISHGLFTAAPECIGISIIGWRRSEGSMRWRIY